MDRVFITDLRVDAVIGIFDWERRIRQTLRVDLEMAVDGAGAAATDSLESAIDYKAVAKWVKAHLQEAAPQLVETAAEGVAAGVRAEVGARWVRVSLHKPGALSDARDVGIVIERGDPG